MCLKEIDNNVNTLIKISASGDWGLGIGGWGLGIGPILWSTQRSLMGQYV